MFASIQDANSSELIQSVLLSDVYEKFFGTLPFPMRFDLLTNHLLRVKSCNAGRTRMYVRIFRPDHLFMQFFTWTNSNNFVAGVRGNCFGNI